MSADLIKRLRDALYFRQPCTHQRVTRPTEENNWLSVCNDCGEKNHLTLTFGHDRERAREIAELIAEADAHLYAAPDTPPDVPQGCLWAVTKGGLTLCQPPKSQHTLATLERENAELQELLLKQRELTGSFITSSAIIAGENQRLRAHIQEAADRADRAISKNELGKHR